jgi:transcriptional regulator with XRE-family HTH domain
MPSLTPHGEKLRSLRVSVGWSQLDLALRAGVSERTVRNAEKSLPLRHDFLGYLAKALAVPLVEISRPTPEFKTLCRWEGHVARLAQVLGELATNHDGSGLLDLISPDIQLDCFGSPCDFEPMNQQFNSYFGESGVKRYLEFGQRTLAACDEVQFNIAPPHGGGDLVLFRSHDHYVGHCGRKFATKSFNLVQFHRGRIFRLDQFHHFVPAAE